MQKISGDMPRRERSSPNPQKSDPQKSELHKKKPKSLLNPVPASLFTISNLSLLPMKWDARLRSGRYRLGGRARLGSAQPTHQKSLHYFASDKKLECAIMLNIHMHILINAGNVVDGSYFSFAKSSVRTGLIFPWKVIGSFASLHVIQLCIRVNK